MFGMATNGTLRGQVSVPDDTYVFPNLSAYKAGQGIAFQASPTKAFNELFGAAVMSESDLRKDAAIKRKLDGLSQRRCSANPQTLDGR